MYLQHLAHVGNEDELRSIDWSDTDKLFEQIKKLLDKNNSLRPYLIAILADCLAIKPELVCVSSFLSSSHNKGVGTAMWELVSTFARQISLKCESIGDLLAYLHADEDDEV
jgi:hypothetical protein